MRHLLLLISDFSSHIFGGSFLPESLGCSVSDGVERDLMAFVVQLVYELVVGVLMADEEGGTSGTVVNVPPPVQESAVGRNVGDTNRIVESEEDELEKIDKVTVRYM